MWMGVHMYIGLNFGVQPLCRLAALLVSRPATSTCLHVRVSKVLTLVFLHDASLTIYICCVTKPSSDSIIILYKARFCWQIWTRMDTFYGMTYSYWCKRLARLMLLVEWWLQQSCTPACTIICASNIKYKIIECWLIKTEGIGILFIERKITRVHLDDRQKY